MACCLWRNIYSSLLPIKNPVFLLLWSSCPIPFFSVLWTSGFLTLVVFQSVSWVRLCDPMDCSIPGSPVQEPMDCSIPGSTISQSLLKFMSIKTVMLSIYLILCHPLLLLPSVFPSIRVFSSALALCIRWPKYWSFIFSISLSSECSGLIFFRFDWFDVLAVQGTLQSLLQHHSLKSSVLHSLLSLLHDPTLASIHNYWKNHDFDHMDLDLSWQNDVFSF